MKKISIKNNFFKKFVFLFLIIILSFNFSFAQTSSSDQSSSSDAAMQSLNKLNNNKGLLPDCAYSNTNPCELKDLFSLIKPVRNILIGLVCSLIVVFAIYYGVSYVFNSDSAEYINNIKKKLWGTAKAIIMLIIIIPVVLAIYAGIGLNQNVLNIVKQIFASVDFNFIPHAYAQTATTTSAQYVDLFPHQGLISTIQKAIKVFINYIAAPILSGGVIYAGFRFVAAQGNPEKLADAKKFATWLAVAIGIAIAAPLVLNILLSTLQSIIDF